VCAPIAGRVELTLSTQQKMVLRRDYTSAMCQAVTKLMAKLHIFEHI